MALVNVFRRDVTWEEGICSKSN